MISPPGATSRRPTPSSISTAFVPASIACSPSTPPSSAASRLSILSRPLRPGPKKSKLLRTAALFAIFSSHERRQMRNKILFALLLCATFVSAQSETADRVAGAVVNAATGKPLARVQIHLRREQDAQSYGAMTASDGRFSIAGVPPGSYFLKIERAGFAVAPDLPEELEIGAEDTANLHFALTPEGAITGRVTDAAGQPVEDVELRADSASARTDANGQFRIGGLAPGQY